jgi:glutathione S-transferase
VSTGPQVVFSNGGFRVPVDTPYRIVTLDFLAGGGDAYPLTALTAANRVDLVAPGTTKTFTTDGAEQRALAQYLADRHPRTTPFALADVAATEDLRIQNLSVRSDSLPQN